MKTKSCLLVIGCVCATTAAHAQGTLVLAPSSMGELVNDHQIFTFPTPTTPLANFGAVQVVFTSPEGYAWKVIEGHGVTCSLDYSDPGYNPESPTMAYEFDFLPGTVPQVSVGSLNGRLSESSFGFYSGFYFADGAVFTSLTITMGYYSQHDWQIAQRPMSPFSNAYFNSPASSMNDPTYGQRLTVIPIPEPNLLALLGAGIMMLWSARCSGRPERRT